MKKWVHFIGICGSAMAPIAVMMKDSLHWHVTGSDKGFFPPFDKYLKESGIDIEPGMKPMHLQKQYYIEKYKKELDIAERPDLVVLGNFFSGSKNPELNEAKNLNLEITHYPGVLEKFVVKENSIVVSGTAGKTTTTGVLVYILKHANLNPSYMVGGLVKNLKDGVEATESKWSVIEGDEPWASKDVKKSKFFFYHPKYLLLTSAAWEHTDMFPSEEDYITNIRNLVKKIPDDGFIVTNKQGENIDKVMKNINKRIIYYSQEEEGDYVYSENKGKLMIRSNSKKDKVWFKEPIKVKLYGMHNMSNLAAAAILAHEAGIDFEYIKQGIQEYEGVKRRLEVRAAVNDIIVIDDFASSPPKAKASIAALRRKYPKNDYRIRVVYEPNIGNRTASSYPFYDHLFELADEVVIPKLSQAKETETLKFFEGDELTDIIKQTHHNVSYHPNDEELVNYLKSTGKAKDIVAFMGSHGFRRMIEDLIKVLNN